MSSYQFVNSLAACYNNGQRGGSSDPTGSGQDYYGGNVVGAPGGGSVVSGVNSAYPNCYSPQMGTAPATATSNYYGTSSPTHHQVTNLSNGSAAADYRNMNGGGQQSTLLALGNLGPSNNNNNNLACKYATTANVVAAAAAAVAGSSDPLTVTNLNNCGSPQDLTTNSNGSSSASSVCSTPRSPPLHLGSGAGAGSGQRSSHSQNSQSNASSNNSTSPNSTSGSQSQQQQSGTTKGSSSNPPHIYPWMKRVHLGQSKHSISYFPSRVGVRIRNI